MYMHLQLTLFVFWSFVLDTWMHIDLFIFICADIEASDLAFLTIYYVFFSVFPLTP